MSNELQKQLNIFKNEIGKTIIGQNKLISFLIVALLSDGHILLEGKPGLAKTKLAKTIAENLQAKFQRIQFTPDLKPNDIIGYEFQDLSLLEKNKEVTKSHELSNEEYIDYGFRFRKGPVFTNILLADELNRSPPMVQSALLEAMEEKQVTVSGITYKLPEVFFVIATQNPFSQHGTFALPEAQLDRFMMHLMVEYPDPKVEQKILQIAHQVEAGTFVAAEKSRELNINPELVIAARKEIAKVTTPDIIEKYITTIMQLSRYGSDYDSLRGAIQIGISPRGGLSLERAARSLAWICGRNEVTIDDCEYVVMPILCHRLTLTDLAKKQQRNEQHLVYDLCRLSREKHGFPPGGPPFS